MVTERPAASAKLVVVVRVLPIMEQVVQVHLGAYVRGGLEGAVEVSLLAELEALMVAQVARAGKAGRTLEAARATREESQEEVVSPVRPERVVF